ncbi:MAG: histidinol dehydrogenase, partial [Solirubrobacterales bacterium]
PTGGAALFVCPFCLGAFMRRTSVVSGWADAAAGLAPAVEAFASAEGFPVHVEPARARAGP